MSTATLRTVAAPINGIAGLTPKQSYAALLVSKAKALAANPIAWLKKAWAAVVDTCHLATPIEHLRSWVAWMKGYAVKGAHYVGWAGGASLAAASVSTKTGRAVLNNTVGHVARAGGWLLRKGYSAVTWGLRHLGKPGNGLADKMDAGCAKVALTTGNFYHEHIAKHLDLNSRAMRLTRDASITAAIFQVGVLVTIPWLSTAIKVVSGLFGLAATSEAVQETGWYDKNVRNNGLEVVVKEPVKVVETVETTTKVETVVEDERGFDQVTAEEAALLTEQETWTTEQWKAHNDATMAEEEGDGPFDKSFNELMEEDGMTVDLLLEMFQAVTNVRKDDLKLDLTDQLAKNKARLDAFMADQIANGNQPLTDEKKAEKAEIFAEGSKLKALEAQLFPERVAEDEARIAAAHAEDLAKVEAADARTEAGPAQAAAKAEDLAQRKAEKDDPVAEALRGGDPVVGEPVQANRKSRRQAGRPARAGGKPA